MKKAQKAGVHEVGAFACSQCLEVYGKHENANICCRCKKCKLKYPRGNWFIEYCGGCNYGEQLRVARRRVRVREEDLASAKDQLKRLLDTGRPVKGSGNK